MSYSRTDTVAPRRRGWLAGAAILLLLLAASAQASERAEPVARDYQTQPPAPAHQTLEQVKAKSAGCMSCHLQTDNRTMHNSPAVRLGCADCHGGDASVFRPQGVEQGSERYRALLKQAHVLPRFPKAWHWPSSANPKRTYSLLNREAPQFIRFVNPGDFRVAKKACGACHLEIIKRSKRSLHATSAMFYGAAAYNNGLLPYKRSIIGEYYLRDGTPAKVTAVIEPTPLMREQSILDYLLPIPAWETFPPANKFRVFERGGRNKSSQFPETGLPNVAGKLQLLELPGKPDIRQSNRGLGTGARSATSVINLTKTRLNGPTLWFLGTNDQPGDYRSSGCSACHVVYANDREKTSAGPYAKYGNMGKSQTIDPTIPHDEPGHPLKHQFTGAIPTSQCMICHMHQPNMFLNTYLGYTMWAYTSGAPYMWPDEQQYPTPEERRHVHARNPAGAAARGLWADVDFLKQVWKLNPKLEHTQFADYHGHGWIFRAVYKKDRQGHLLDADGDIVSRSDPDKWDKAVHLKSIHAEKGMHCVDCHFAKGNHGNGHLYGQVAAGVTIACIDCHGTVDAYPTLLTSGPASATGATDMSLLRTPWGESQFEWIDGELIQRSMLYPDKQWNVSLVKDTVDPGSPAYNARAARAKLMSENTDTLHWGQDVNGPSERAHSYENMECYACHTSWTTSCGGCHLPIYANRKTPRLHYQGKVSRNYATYNPQVVRGQIFMLGKRPPYKGGKYAPVRSSSALVLSSINANREHIYIQQPPVSSSGYSSQAFNPHFPHTVRKTETKGCNDCHLTRNGANNAIIAQLLGYGTNFIDFIGRHLWVGEAGHVEAVRVTRWKEPQAVIGSYLDRYAYPDWYAEHLAHDRRLQVAHGHDSGRVGCVQLRGEYLYTAAGENGFRVFDVASVDNKGFSERIITAPFSPLGHDTHVDTVNATCMALATNQPVYPPANKGHLMRVVNKEQPFHPMYNYAFITDAVEGLILVNINTLADGEPRNNFLKRALTWNPDGILDGARHITVGGHYLYIMANAGMVIVSVEQPLKPSVVKVVPLNHGRASALQFRYLFVTDADGLKVIEVTTPSEAHLVPGALLPLQDAHKLHLARTYAYVAAGHQGLAIVNIRHPEAMKLYQLYDAQGRLQDVRDVVLGTTDVSLFAYVADARTGVHVLQLTSPELQPQFYGFSPPPKPKWISSRATAGPALSLSEGLKRDRAVDETGHQIAVFGRRGSRPLSVEEMHTLYLNDQGEPWFVPAEIPEKIREQGE